MFNTLKIKNKIKNLFTIFVFSLVVIFLISGSLSSVYAQSAKNDFGNSRIDVAINGKDSSGDNGSGETLGDGANNGTDTTTGTKTSSGNQTETLQKTDAKLGFFTSVLILGFGLLIYYNKSVKKKVLKALGISSAIVMLLIMILPIFTNSSVGNVGAISFNGDGYGVKPGDILTYRVVISNTGSNSRDGVVAKVKINQGLLYKSGTIRLDDGTPFSDANDTDGASFQSPNMLILNAGTINGGSVKVYYFDAEVQGTLKVAKPELKISATGFEEFPVSYNNIAYNPLDGANGVEYVSTIDQLIQVDGDPVITSGECKSETNGDVNCNIYNIADMTSSGKKIVATVYNSSSDIPIPVKAEISIPSGSVTYNYNMNTNKVDKITVKVKNLFELTNPATVGEDGVLSEDNPSEYLHYLFMYDNETGTLLRLGYLNNTSSEMTYVYNEDDYEDLYGNPVNFTDFDEIFVSVIKNDGNYNPDDIGNNYLWIKSPSWLANATELLKFGSIDSNTEINISDFNNLSSLTLISSSSDNKRDLLKSSFTGLPSLPNNFGYNVKYYIQENENGNNKTGTIIPGTYTSGTLTTDINDVSGEFNTFYKENNGLNTYTYILKLNIQMALANEKLIASGSPETMMFTKAFNWDSENKRYATLNVPSSAINEDYALSMDKVAFSIETAEEFNEGNVFMSADFDYNKSGTAQNILFGQVGVSSFDSGNGSFKFTNNGGVLHSRLSAKLNNMPVLPPNIAYHLYGLNIDVDGTVNATSYLGTFTMVDSEFVLNITKTFNMTKQYNKLVVVYGPVGLETLYGTKLPNYVQLYDKSLYEFSN